MLMPLELKSGKKYLGAEHMMQVALYSLLMPERYGGGGGLGSGVHGMNGGLLLYLKSGEVLGVGVKENEVASILQHRNKLAAALTHKQVCAWGCGGCLGAGLQARQGSVRVRVRASVTVR